MLPNMNIPNMLNMTYFLLFCHVNCIFLYSIFMYVFMYVLINIVCQNTILINDYSTSTRVSWRRLFVQLHSV